MNKRMNLMYSKKAGDTDWKIGGDGEKSEAQKLLPTAYPGPGRILPGDVDIDEMAKEAAKVGITMDFRDYNVGGYKDDKRAEVEAFTQELLALPVTYDGYDFDLTNQDFRLFLLAHYNMAMAGVDLQYQGIMRGPGQNYVYMGGNTQVIALYDTCKLRLDKIYVGEVEIFGAINDADITKLAMDAILDSDEIRQAHYQHVVIDQKGPRFPQKREIGW